MVYARESRKTQKIIYLSRPPHLCDSYFISMIEEKSQMNFHMKWDRAGKQIAFTQNDYLMIQDRDKTEKVYLKEIIEKPGL